MRGILHYNEQKVGHGEANLILASGFAGDIEKMNIHQKIKRFEHLTQLKPSVKTNALHISLNFDSSEKIDHTKMQQIAIAYMEGIGFAEQPYLVYRHHDVAHQHVHIATTSIQRNGKSINLHNIGTALSEPARKQIEKDFNLVVAESKSYKTEPAIKPINPATINYGDIPTKRAISNVIAAVIDAYKFTSIPEFNAILKQFNVVADRGAEETEMFQKKGLQYSLLNEKGEKVGVPIKASSFYSKPTLRNLEKKFERNLEKRKPFRQDLMKRIDQVTNRFESISKTTLTSELKKRGINLVFRENRLGQIYGLTFVDHINKAVFNGSDLGKSYSAKAIGQLMNDTDKSKTYLQPKAQEKTYLPKSDFSDKSYLSPTNTTSYLDELLGKVQTDITPTIWQRKRKKRKGISR